MKIRNYTGDDRSDVVANSGYNPYRDPKSGRFTDAPFSTPMTVGSTNRSRISMAKNVQQLGPASSGKINTNRAGMVAREFRGKREFETTLTPQQLESIGRANVASHLEQQELSKISENSREDFAAINTISLYANEVTAAGREIVNASHYGNSEGFKANKNFSLDMYDVRWRNVVEHRDRISQIDTSDISPYIADQLSVSLRRIDSAATIIDDVSRSREITSPGFEAKYVDVTSWTEDR